MHQDRWDKLESVPVWPSVLASMLSRELLLDVVFEALLAARLSAHAVWSSSRSDSLGIATATTGAILQSLLAAAV
jgi:hypothetical protein